MADAIVPRLPEDLDAQDLVAQRIWFIPPAPGVDPHYIFEYVGGPKRYLNLWMRHPYGGETTSWNWVLHDSAVLLWEQAGL
jgi:hypothetical protein